MATPRRIVRQLIDALNDRNEAEALRLLQQEEVPGLNTSFEEDLGTVLHWAIFTSQFQVALRILDRPDYKLVNAKDISGETALHYAAECGSLEVCQAILSRKDFTAAQVNSKRTHYTALGTAMKHGHGALAELLRALAGPDLIDLILRSYNEPEALHILKQPEVPGLNTHFDEEFGTVLHWAIFNSYFQVALGILARSDYVQVNAKDMNGATALHYAAEAGSLEMCEAILSCVDFLDLHAVSERFGTALETAEAFGHQEIHALLEAAAAPGDRILSVSLAGSHPDGMELTCRTIAGSIAAPFQWQEETPAAALPKLVLGQVRRSGFTGLGEPLGLWNLRLLKGSGTAELDLSRDAPSLVEQFGLEGP